MSNKKPVFEMWVYNEIGDSKIINSDQAAAEAKKGWKDSPAAFEKKKSK